ncbi:carbohydrate-binding domain-containing protein [Paenibacillus sp. sgz500958]|uniref:carbohydrate-binding domain-containing protein n=1 Tax=Paenibacillus sp. sgz500958 TaxID=3242475 RepID=UPI0036D2683F
MSPIKIGSGWVKVWALEYVLSGEVDNVTVVVDAGEDTKVQIVLDGVSIINEDAPAIYVKAADIQG